MDAKRYIGRVTTGATIGTAITGSLTVIIGYILSQYGITLPAGVSDAVFILLSSLGALIGGRQSPSDKITFEGVGGATLFLCRVVGEHPLGHAIRLGG